MSGNKLVFEILQRDLHRSEGEMGFCAGHHLQGALVASVAPPSSLLAARQLVGRQPACMLSTARCLQMGRLSSRRHSRQTLGLSYSSQRGGPSLLVCVRGPRNARFGARPRWAHLLALRPALLPFRLTSSLHHPLTLPPSSLRSEKSRRLGTCLPPLPSAPSTTRSSSSAPGRLPTKVRLSCSLAACRRR